MKIFWGGGPRPPTPASKSRSLCRNPDVDPSNSAETASKIRNSSRGTDTFLTYGRRLANTQSGRYLPPIWIVYNIAASSKTQQQDETFRRIKDFNRINCRYKAENRHPTLRYNTFTPKLYESGTWDRYHSTRNWTGYPNLGQACPRIVSN